MQSLIPLFSLCPLFLIAVTSCGPRPPEADENPSNAVANEILAELRGSGIQLDPAADQDPPGACPITQFAQLVKRATWTEHWPAPPAGQAAAGSAAAQPSTVTAQPAMSAQTVTAELWTAAIQAALEQCQAVTVPARSEPYYIDAPLILRTGNHLKVDPRAEIRLKPDSNTCMLRNRSLLNGQLGPVEMADPDTGIVIEGGIWTTLSTTTQQTNGNNRGQADSQDSVSGAHGVIVLNNAERVQVRNVTIRKSKAFGVHLSNVSHFLVENMVMESTWRDGVHLNGPARYGLIRGMRGVTSDDFVALNAWDWKNYAMTFGPITHVLVEDIQGDERLLRQTNDTIIPDGSAEIRLLAGTKRFTAGGTIDCDISDCVFRDIRAVRSFKLYDQPNLELGREVDFADPIGRMSNLFFGRLQIQRPTSLPTFQVHADIDGLTIEDVELNFPLERPGEAPFRLVGIGPMSYTFKRSSDPNDWVEVFSPDKDCTVKNLSIGRVRALQAAGSHETVPVEPSALVEVIRQSPNPDYPKTTPRGGAGKGTLEK